MIGIGKFLSLNVNNIINKWNEKLKIFKLVFLKVNLNLCNWWKVIRLF